MATTSGISRRMITNLEGGDTNISLSSLDRLAEALGVDFIAIVSDPNASSRRIEQVAWRGRDVTSEAVLLGSVPASREAQLWRWSLAPGERYTAEPDPAGWHEMIVVTEGCLHIELAKGGLMVEAGDFAIYSSAQAYAYVNTGDAPVSFIRNVVS
ncbi:helix-turn-helix domain-containing protein [Sphingomonas sp. FARSPH]|uniref:helix-turn-helix domain-containing protein n=1 Tax=Sphingomonas sp. FARSPH TaxID=2219696 RepID=UPI001E2ADD48|nr:XRE family transcriptional regulator [Sphingomonas sp. FARSPH]